MEVAFSGVVKLTDISDFVSPSQDCVVAAQPSSAPRQPVSDEPVKISLQDCLACSGCVTSAETVLLENQSSEEFLRKVEDSEVKVVVSLSSQSRAALSVAFDIPPLQLVRCLIGFFRWLGVDYVMDMNSANDLTLLAAAEEFIGRYKDSKSNGGSTTLLASSCPGWICYAEKTHGDWCLPYLAKTCSAQACIGKIIKSRSCRRWGIPPERLYHCTIMSCYDKKLEAARSDFRIEDGAVPEVDACLTSTEVVRLIRQRLGERQLALFDDGGDIYLDTMNGGRDDVQELFGFPGRSGGLLEFVYRTAAKQIFHLDVPSGPLAMKTLRNSNFQEIVLEDENGDVLLRFASVYGFRNIQSLVQKLKRGRCPYDYVEVMACPSGCINGGGQPKQQSLDADDILTAIDRRHLQDVTIRDPGSNSEIEAFLDVALETEYRQVIQSIHRAVIDW